MNLHKYLFIAIFGLSAMNGHCQSASDSLLAKDNVLIPLPTISINVGFNHLMSDVKLVNGPSPFRQLGYQLTITQRVTKFLNASFELYGGTVYGEEQRNQSNLNFRTSLFSQHLNLEYNFYPLLKPDQSGIQRIRPYIGFGLGLLSFRSKGDLKSASGRTYQYWSDGNIYAETEGSIASTEATVLERDFVYESDLRDANLDGLRKYSQLAFSLPINAGIRFQITKNVGVNAAFGYAINFTDMIDNVSLRGSGDRAGSKGNDNHLYGSLGLCVFLGTTKPSAKPVKPTPEQLAAERERIKAEKQAQKLKEQQAAAEQKIQDQLTLETEKNTESGAEIDPNTSLTGELNEGVKNSTGEGIERQASQSTDENPSTELPISDAKDTENKNTANQANKTKEATSVSKAKEPISRGEGESVDAQGKTKAEETKVSDSLPVKSDAKGTESSNSIVTESKKDRNNPASTSVKNDKNKTKSTEENPLLEKLENTTPKQSGNFHWADLDKDGMISPIEVLHFIDQLFEGGSTRSVEDIQFLIDYYFEQE